MKSTIKVVLGIIGAIIIGAIGSGVWEELLSPFLKWLISGLTSFFSSISKSYADSLYSDIGKGSLGISGHFILVPYLIVFLIMSMLPFSLSFIVHIIARRKISRAQIFFKKKQNEEIKSTLNKQEQFEKAPIKFKKIKPFIYINYLISISVLIIILSRITKDAYAYDVITYIEQSIDIVSPYVSDIELKKIKSEYRQIDNREKFQKFNLKLTEIADSNKIALPNISALEIE